MSLVSDSMMPVIPGMKFDIPNFFQKQPKSVIKFLSFFTDYAMMANTDGFEAVDLTKFNSAFKLSGDAFGFMQLPGNLDKGIKHWKAGEVRNVSVDAAKGLGDVCDIAKFFSRSGVSDWIPETEVGYGKCFFSIYSNGNKAVDNVVNLYQISQRDDGAETEIARAKLWYEDRAEMSDLVKSVLMTLTYTLALAPLLLGFAFSSTLLTILGTVTLVAATANFFFEENAKDLQANLSIA